MELVPALARWLHFLAGVMWIGLLYYFNFVQVAAMKAATADGTAAGHHEARGAARAVLLSLGGGRDVARGRGAARRLFRAARSRCRRAIAGIGIGAWLGTIMLLNVWGLIWPNQKKILGIEARDRRGEEQGAAGRVPRVTRQHDAVDPDAVLHGHRLAPPVLNPAAPPGAPQPEKRKGMARPSPVPSVLGIRRRAVRTALRISRRRASARARGAPAPRATAWPSAARAGAGCRSARRSPRNSRSCRRRSA